MIVSFTAANAEEASYDSVFKIHTIMKQREGFSRPPPLPSHLVSEEAEGLSVKQRKAGDRLHS